MPRRDYQGTAQQLTPSFWQMGVHIDRCHCTFALPQAHSRHLGFYLDIAAFAVRVASPLPQPSEGTFRFSATSTQYQYLAQCYNVQVQRLRIEASTGGASWGAN